MAALPFILAREHTFVSMRSIIGMHRKLNEYRIGVEPAFLAVALTTMAEEYAKMHCSIEDCEVCSSFVDEWWDLLESLPTVMKEDVQRGLRGRLIDEPHVYTTGW
jgi:hypothetical protein